MRDYRFIPSTVGLILVVILVPTFVMLGFWQLDRAHQRESLNQLQDERLQEPPLVLGPHERVDLDAIRYRELILKGQFDREHQFLVDNQLEGQAAGYHVLVPFRLEGSDRSVLINRGWVALGSDRTQRPDVGGLPEGRIEIRGRADYLHRVGFKLKGAEIPTEGWPAIVQVPEPIPLSTRLGYPVEGFQVLLGPAEPGGYVRQFRPVRLDAGKNRGYALQWFLFAVATFSLFIRSSLRKSPHRS
jgi:surfeit locus 1 family protein